MATLDVHNGNAPPTALRQMSEEEFIAWSLSTDVRAEWVDGEVILMDAVNTGHGRLLSFLNKLVGGFVDEHNLGETFNEPVTVRFPRQRRRRSPDLFVVKSADRDLVVPEHFDGVPSLIVEIVSPDSRHRDAVEKFREYRRAGVLEYWLADPEMRSFAANALGQNGRYSAIPEEGGRVCSLALPGLYFRPDWVWLLQFPKVAPLLSEMSADRTRLPSSSPPPPSDKPVG